MLVPTIFWKYRKATVLATKLGEMFSFRKGDHDLRKLDQEHLSGDPEQAKLDYWREESLFHAFHVLFHKLWNRLKKDDSQDRFTRTFELFFYAHQQMVRRYVIKIKLY
jgi:hypothetical protein